MAQKSDYKDEYLDASENMRQFGNIRFAQMTLYIAITAGIFSVLFQTSSELTLVTIATLKAVGILTTVVFWVLDQRAISYWRHFRNRAIELEKHLGFLQHSKSPAEKIFSATNAIRFLYAGILVFWITTLIWSAQYY